MAMSASTMKQYNNTIALNTSTAQARARAHEGVWAAIARTVTDVVGRLAASCLGQYISLCWLEKDSLCCENVSQQHSGHGWLNINTTNCTSMAIME